MMCRFTVSAIALSVILGCASTPAKQEQAASPPTEDETQTPAGEATAGEATGDETTSSETTGDKASAEEASVREPSETQATPKQAQQDATTAHSDGTERDLATARRLATIAAPTTLAQAIELIESQGLSQEEEAIELLYVADRLYDHLYSALDKPSLDVERYTGKYREAFSRIATGDIAGTFESLTEEQDFFSLVTPAFLLLSDASIPQDSDLGRLETLLEAAEAQGRSSVLPPYFLALIENRRSNSQAVQALAAESTRRDASFYPGRLLLAQTIQPTKNARRVIDLIEEVHQVIAPSADSLGLLAESYLALGETEAGGAAAARAILLAPDRHDLLLLRIGYLEQSHNAQQALRLLNLLLARNPYDTQLLLRQARVLHESLRNPQQALNVLLKTGDVFVDDPDFHETKGRILLELDRADEGLRELTRALELDPQRISVLRYMLRDAVRMGRWVQSTIYLNQVLEVSRAEDDLQLAYSVYKNLGEQNEALVVAQQLYAMRPKSHYAAEYAEQLLLLGQTPECLEIVAQGLAQIHDPDTRSALYFLKARTLEGLDGAANGGAQIIEYLQLSILENPDNVPALVRIAELFMQVQDYRKAYLYLKRAHELEPDDYGVTLQFDQARQHVETEENEDR